MFSGEIQTVKLRVVPARHEKNNKNNHAASRACSISVFKLNLIICFNSTFKPIVQLNADASSIENIKCKVKCRFSKSVTVKVTKLVKMSFR